MNLYMMYNAKIEKGICTLLELDFTSRGNMLNLCTNVITGILLISDDIPAPPEKESCTKNQINFIVPQYSQRTDVHDDWLHLLKEEPLSNQFSKCQAKTVCLCYARESEISATVLLKLETFFPLKLAILDCVTDTTKRLFLKYGWHTSTPYN